MELRHLQYFLAVADAGNVTRAAARCYVAQSALSAQIARLEAEVGSTLFVRTARGMRLTPAGEVLRPLAERVLADVAQTRAQMDALAGVVRGRLRIGLIQGLPNVLDVAGLLAAFHTGHPDVALSVRTGASLDLARQVLDGDLDLALVAVGPADLPGPLRHRRLIDDPLVGVVSAAAHPDVGGEALTVADLAARGPFIHYLRRSGLRLAVDAAFTRAGVDVAAPFELDQLTDMIRLAALGLGVTIVPASALPDSARPDSSPPAGDAGRGWRAVRLADPAAVHAVGVVTAEDPGAAAERLLSMLPRTPG